MRLRKPKNKPKRWPRRATSRKERLHSHRKCSPHSSHGREPARRCAGGSADRQSDTGSGAGRLSRKPDGDLDRLAKRLKETEQAIAELADAQERLQKQTADAAGITDPGERRTKLEQLAREQDELRKKADEMAQRLSRLQQNEAAGDIRRAQLATCSRRRRRSSRGSPPNDSRMRPWIAWTMRSNKLSRNANESRTSCSATNAPKFSTPSRDSPVAKPL